MDVSGVGKCVCLVHVGSRRRFLKDSAHAVMRPLPLTRGDSFFLAPRFDRIIKSLFLTRGFRKWLRPTVPFIKHANTKLRAVVQGTFAVPIDQGARCVWAKLTLRRLTMESSWGIRTRREGGSYLRHTAKLCWSIRNIINSNKCFIDQQIFANSTVVTLT